jgi:Fe-S-cluster containining protein
MHPTDAPAPTRIPLAFVAADAFECRAGCGACCIAPSISSPIPGMPNGKRAGERCVQLTDANLCALFGKPERPVICGRLRAEPDMCGADAASARAWLGALERATAP